MLTRFLYDEEKYSKQRIHKDLKKEIEATSLPKIELYGLFVSLFVWLKG